MALILFVAWSPFASAEPLHNAARDGDLKRFAR
jgi:hypothetical protein